MIRKWLSIGVYIGELIVFVILSPILLAIWSYFSLTLVQFAIILLTCAVAVNFVSELLLDLIWKSTKDDHNHAE